MKKIFFTICIFSSFNFFAQGVSSDPAVEPMIITNLVSSIISPAQLSLNETILLKVPILNKSTSVGVPAGTCRVKIGLGSKLILKTGFDLTTVRTSNYFSWSASVVGSQVIVTGELVNDLPPNYRDTALFELYCNALGSSTITNNFLVTNHTPGIALSDDNGANNLASLPYTISLVNLPLHLINFSASMLNCKANLNWTTTKEINTSHFEIEKSTNGIVWVKIGSLIANGNSLNTSNYAFEDITDEPNNVKAFYRVKIIDNNNSYRYTKIIIMTNDCNNTQVIVYPNPVVSGTINFTISGYKNKANVVLKTITGAIVSTKLATNGANNMDASKLANGVYIFSVFEKNSIIKNIKLIIENHK